MVTQISRRHFEALTAYFARYARSFNWMIMLGFFTNTALHRLFTMQMTTPGTTKITTVFIMSLKQDLPEVDFSTCQIIHELLKHENQV